MDSRSPCTTVHSLKLFFFSCVCAWWDHSALQYGTLIRQRHEVPLLWGPGLPRLVSYPNGCTLSFGKTTCLLRQLFTHNPAIGETNCNNFLSTFSSLLELGEGEIACPARCPPFGRTRNRCKYLCASFVDRHVGNVWLIVSFFFCREKQLEKSSALLADSKLRKLPPSFIMDVCEKQ